MSPKDPEVLKTLKAARDLLAQPNRWCKNAKARNRLGQARSPHSLDTTSWDMTGALERVASNTATFGKARNFVCHTLGVEDPSLARWNDNASHTQVLAALDAAITLYQKSD